MSTGLLLFAAAVVAAFINMYLYLSHGGKEEEDRDRGWRLRRESGRGLWHYEEPQAGKWAQLLLLRDLTDFREPPLYVLLPLFPETLKRRRAEIEGRLHAAFSARLVILTAEPELPFKVAERQRVLARI